MSEIRQDRTNGSWVIIAPERGRRPGPGRDRGRKSEPIPAFDPDCPFCPGNEHLLPGIIEAAPSDRPPGWRTRVVANKYPAVRPETGAAADPEGAGPAAAGYGYHEVIVETGRHDADLDRLDEPELTAVVQAYRCRSIELMARPAIASVLVFRNHGRRAGASLAHPHSQVIAIGMTPPRLAAATAWACAHHARRGRCVTCEEIELELVDGRRVVEATERFLVVVPFAAAGPCEQRILPRRHQPLFARIDEAELIELGGLLRRSIGRLKATLDDPPYRYAIEPGAAGPGNAAYSHWSLRLAPEVATAGGFELGAGLPINPSRPEDDAEALRLAAIAAGGVAN